MSLNGHISSVFKNALSPLCTFILIRKYLTQNAAEQLVQACVTLRLDMGNSLLCG
ncbi:hypothetical protein HOLleu_13484 [Holothuria leucospilota]|uniref:Uncharacterized protein n=1 Tax=Holothuria leucospilota TaxID=206669 RepID=A0A9Q1CCJ1_HOLLE|nr:hypothetical protein HOLleu_13484 [Holothuria leucospilota]